MPELKFVVDTQQQRSARKPVTKPRPVKNGQFVLHPYSYQNDAKKCGDTQGKQLRPLMPRDATSFPADHVDTRNGRPESAHNASFPLLHPRPLPIDPYKWTRRDDSSSGAYAWHYYAAVIVPSQASIYELFDVTNVFGSSFFELLSTDEAVYHAGVADVLAIIAQLQDQASALSSCILKHKINAISKLRQAISNIEKPTSEVLSAVAFLAALDFAQGELESAAAHRKTLAYLVAWAGGIDNLGRDGLDKSFILQLDSFWALTTGTHVFPHQSPPYVPSYLEPPYSTQHFELLARIPGGFQTLAVDQLLAIETIELIARIADACSNSRYRRGLPPGDEPDVHSKKQRFSSFIEACPCLGVTDDGLLGLDKVVCLALLLFCSNAFNALRSSTTIYAGARRALATKLEAVTACSVSEKLCMMWAWIIAIDSWRLDRGDLLHAQGTMLLSRFKVLFPEVHDLDSLGKHLDEFFWTDELMAALKVYWDN